MVPSLVTGTCDYCYYSHVMKITRNPVIVAPDHVWSVYSQKYKCVKPKKLEISDLRIRTVVLHSIHAAKQRQRLES